MKKIVLFIICSLFLEISHAQTAKQLGHLIPIKELHEDLEMLKYQLETVHAALYTYTSKEEMDAAFAKIREQLNRPMYDIEFYRLVAPLQQKIKNGHSMIIPSERWDQIKEKELPIFPFDTYWVNNKLYILRNLSNDESVKPGSLIKTINGELAGDIFNELIDNWTSDGHNRTFPAFQISSDFSNFYPNIKGVPLEFEIELEDVNGVARSVKVKALLNETLNAIALSRYGLKRLPWYMDEDSNAISLKISNETAVLKVPTFDEGSKGDDGNKYPKFYEAAFQKIRTTGVKNLILDLRDNGGGDPKPQLALLSHLINEPIVLYRKVYGITNQIAHIDLYEKHGAALNKRLGKFLEKKGTIYTLKESAEKKFGLVWTPTQPAPNVFTGNLFVLTNGRSFSATGEVAGMLKSYRKDAVFVGEETGGNPTQNTSGVMIMMSLPNSKIRVRQSLICFETNVNFDNDGYGAKPDYPVKNTIEQELIGEDSVMQWTLDFINNRTK